MANYECAIRTNYFHVKDKEAFLEFTKKVVCCEDNLDVWEKTDKDGKTVFGFGCFSSIMGISKQPEEDEDTASYDNFIEELKKLIADDDAVIIFEIGREKLRYLNGTAEIVTSDDYTCLNLTDSAVNQARKMLNNSKWNTNYSY